MFITGKDRDGRFMLSTSENLVIRETLDQNNISTLTMQTPVDQAPKWIVSRQTSKAKVKQKFDQLKNQWKAEQG